MSNLIAQSFYDTTGTDPARIEDLEAVFANIIKVAISFAGIAFFVTFLMGGFKYLTAGGDPKKMESAKGTLTTAIGGLVLVAVAYLILVAISDFTGVDVTLFDVYQD